ncbi:hypothetical protein HS088_TW22G01344 [Tripterygium wilfordii]|uniref:SKP1 component POZ domain-containing protein n=1 Tax=Tripterygium wilfordii TaxID=458696 RepID=A0A7J7C0M7_TRIWF|nr:hypothetical protein HS088_TW22G01344 [Tripterygium wilfordii]
MASSKKITLISSDGESFEMDETVALEAQTIKHMIEDGVSEGGIPTPNVTSKILAKVIEYCKKHVESKSADDGSRSDDELKAWDTEFMKVDQRTVFELALAYTKHYENAKELARIAVLNSELDDGAQYLGMQKQSWGARVRVHSGHSCSMYMLLVPLI